MELEFVERLPSSSAGAKRNGTREDVLAKIADALLDQPGVWAVFPWQKTRPDLLDLEDEETRDRRVLAHMRGIQTRINKGAEPFDQAQFEFTVRRGIGFIRVAPLSPRAARNLGL